MHPRMFACQSINDTRSHFLNFFADWRCEHNCPRDKCLHKLLIQSESWVAENVIDAIVPWFWIFREQKQWLTARNLPLNADMHDGSPFQTYRLSQEVRESFTAYHNFVESYLQELKEDNARICNLPVAEVIHCVRSFIDAFLLPFYAIYSIVSCLTCTFTVVQIEDWFQRCDDEGLAPIYFLPPSHSTENFINFMPPYGGTLSPVPKEVLHRIEAFQYTLGSDSHAHKGEFVKEVLISVFAPLQVVSAVFSLQFRLYDFGSHCKRV